MSQNGTNANKSIGPVANSARDRDSSVHASVTNGTKQDLNLRYSTGNKDDIYCLYSEPAEREAKKAREQAEQARANGEEEAAKLYETKARQHEEDAKPVSINGKAMFRATMLANLVAGATDFDEPIPTQMPAKKYIEQVVLWAEHHENEPIPAKEKKFGAEELVLDEWQVTYFNDLDNDYLFHVFMGANFFELKDLLDRCAFAVAGMIKGKKVEEIRELWGIQNDFTPEEEEQIRRENEWAEER